MSWGGLKKSIARTGTNLMQKTGQIDKTDDSAFGADAQNFKILEKNVNVLQKEAKAYLDAMKNMTASQTRIAENMDAIFGDNSDAAMTAHAYRRAVEDLDSRQTQSYEGPFRATVLEPVGKFAAHLPEVSNTIQKRNKKLLDYDAARTKARKSSTDDPAKAQRVEKELEDAQAVYETINNAVANELPQLLDLRIPYLDPSFEALVRMQTKFAEESYEKIGSVQRYLTEGVRDDYANGRLDTQVEEALGSLRELSICGLA